MDFADQKAPDRVVSPTPNTIYQSSLYNGTLCGTYYRNHIILLVLLLLVLLLVYIIISITTSITTSITSTVVNTSSSIPLVCLLAN